jgi:hypothetical protein
MSISSLVSFKMSLSASKSHCFVDESLKLPLNVTLLPYDVARGFTSFKKLASPMSTFDSLTRVFFPPVMVGAFTASFADMPCDAPIDTTVCTSSMIRLNSQMRQSPPCSNFMSGKRRHAKIRVI